MILNLVDPNGGFSLSGITGSTNMLFNAGAMAAAGALVGGIADLVIGGDGSGALIGAGAGFLIGLIGIPNGDAISIPSIALNLTDDVLNVSLRSKIEEETRKMNLKL